MTQQTNPIRILLSILLTSLFFSAFPQKKPVPKAPVKPAAQPTPAKPDPAALQTPATPPEEKKTEEQELQVPKPTSAKLPEATREEADINKRPFLGTFQLTFTAGLSNFNRVTENATTGERREYSLPWLAPATLLGFELAFRMGPDKNKNHDTGDGFQYYRSNSGMFADFEIGTKFQNPDQRPTRFDYTSSINGVTTHSMIDLGYDYTDPTFQTSTVKAVQNLKNAGISPQLRSAAGGVAADTTTFYANTYYHLTWLNFIFNFGSTFRWFDASMGPSLRVWYYRDYSDPLRTAIRNDDATQATFMIVYRQYIQLFSKLRLSTHIYFPALAYFSELAQSSRFNTKEYIANAALEYYAIRVGKVGLTMKVGYEGHWWLPNPYSADRVLRTGFVPDKGFTDASFAGFEQKMRTQWEGFAGVSIVLHL